MNEQLNVSLGLDISYVYGLVNGVEANFSLFSPGVWSTTVPKSADGKYIVQITAYNSLGTSTQYNTTMYKLEDLITPKTDWTKDDYYNAVDLNRVEANTQCIKDYLVELGYTPNIGIIKSWVVLDFIDINDINRVENNIEALGVSFYKPTDWGDKENWIADKKFNYLDAIRYENNIKILMEMIKLIKDNIKYSGAFSAGEEVI